MVSTLVRNILANDGDFELRVHVDGSTDGTDVALAAVKDARLHVTRSENAGRASAMARMVREAAGAFVMIYDDDDILDPAGLSVILADCAQPLKVGCCGYIYHYRQSDGAQLGESFPCMQSNFLKLRADQHIRGDKREVVQADLFRAVLAGDVHRYRRVPTSLYWARMALSHDVICRNVIIGTHIYQSSGMTANIASLKRADPQPIFKTHYTRLSGWWHGRYRSPRFAMRAAVAATAYGLRSLRARSSK